MNWLIVNGFSFLVSFENIPHMETSPRPLSKEGSFSCPTCYDTGLRFTRSQSRDHPHVVASYDWGPILTRILTGIIVYESWCHLCVSEDITIWRAVSWTFVCTTFDLLCEGQQLGFFCVHSLLLCLFAWFCVCFIFLPFTLEVSIICRHTLYRYMLFWSPAAVVRRLSVCLSVCPSFYLSFCPSVCKLFLFSTSSQKTLGQF